MTCYKVEVETTNSMKDCFHVKETDEYLDCENGVVYVCAKSAKTIYDRFGDELIRNVRRIGIAYSMHKGAES